MYVPDNRIPDSALAVAVAQLDIHWIGFKLMLWCHLELPDRNTIAMRLTASLPAGIIMPIASLPAYVHHPQLAKAVRSEHVNA
jgi:hypothetical protein